MDVSNFGLGLRFGLCAMEDRIGADHCAVARVGVRATARVGRDPLGRWIWHSLHRRSMPPRAPTGSLRWS